MFPQAEGYYVHTDGLWVRALTLPCDHIPGWRANAAFLMRDFCHVDKHGRPAVAYAGLLFDGVSCFGQNYGTYLFEGAIHDSECAIVRSLPPGPERRAAQASTDARFRTALVRRGMAPARAGYWYAFVSLHAWKLRNAVKPSYLTHLEAYYRHEGLPEQYIEHGLRIAADNRRAV
jgi:hypothetical protein